MARRSGKPRSAARRPRRGGPGTLRAVLAALLLLLIIAAVLFVALRTRRGEGTTETAVSISRAVAARHGLSAEHVVAGADPSQATIHLPAGADASRLALDLEAAAHNQGGRLEPRPVEERGGYAGLLAGEVNGARWRILLVQEEPPPTPAPVAAKRRDAPRPRLAIVLDDAGYSLDAVAGIARLPIEVAVAVLPNARRSAEVAEAMRAQGREVLLHLPMQPNGDASAGEGAVEVGQDQAEVGRRVEHALHVVGPARGVNNHMGSRASADEATMAAVMRVLIGREVYFLDSRTTPDTVAEQQAKAHGVPALHRDVFLDVVAEPEAVRAALALALGRARTRGSAVAIGHVHPVTLEVLAAELQGALGDVQLVRPSSLTGSAARTPGPR